MRLEEIADWCERVAGDPLAAERALKALASAAREYRPQTHVETYALDEIFEAAAGAVDL